MSRLVAAASRMPVRAATVVALAAFASLGASGGGPGSEPRASLDASGGGPLSERRASRPAFAAQKGRRVVEAKPTSAEQVEQLERSLVQAISAKDLAAYDRLVADDYVVVNLDGTETTKAEVLASYKSGERGYTGLKISEVKVHVFGDTAIVSARTAGLRREKGQEAPNRRRYVRVYARRQGQWRAVTQMSAPLEES